MSRPKFLKITLVFVWVSLLISIILRRNMDIVEGFLLLLFALTSVAFLHMIFNHSRYWRYEWKQEKRTKEYVRGKQLGLSDVEAFAFAIRNCPKRQWEFQYEHRQQERFIKETVRH